MFEGPGSATQKHVVDSGFAVLFLAAPIFFGYALLAPDRIGLRAVASHPAKVVVASIAPTPALAPSPAVTPSMPSAIPSPVATPALRSGPIASLRPVLVPPPTVAPPPATPDVPRVPWPPTVNGRVTDDEDKPIAGASIVVGGREHRTADDGTFTLTPPPHASLIAKRPGYRRVVVEPTQDKVEIVLKPQAIKAAY